MTKTLSALIHLELPTGATLEALASFPRAEVEDSLDCTGFRVPLIFLIRVLSTGGASRNFTVTRGKPLPLLREIRFAIEVVILDLG